MTAAGDRATVLVLRALYLGDLLTGLPALSMVRAALPGHRIVLAAPAGVGAIAMSAGVVDEITPALELAQLADAPRGVELGIDLHGNGPASRELVVATGVQRVVAWAGGPFVWRADEHEVHRWCRLVGEALDIAEPWPGVAGSVPIPVGLHVPAGVTVVHPGAKATARRWPQERYAAVAGELLDAGHRVVVTGGTGEEDLVAEISASSGAEPWVGRPLADLLALVAGARLVVCGDTGVAHVASAYRTPSVVLFGPVSPALWGPPDDQRHVALWCGGGSGRVAGAVGDAGDPHASVTDARLLRISVDDVLSAVERVPADVR